MRTIILVIILLTCACFSQAQVNYVLNGGFEKYSQCPANYDQIRLANYWNGIDTEDASPHCLPDYCNICSQGNASVPLNGDFYQYPRTGAGMVEVRMLVNPSFQPDVRDYLQGKLYNHLTAGKTYCVTFYVSLEEYSSNAIDKIGAYLDNGSIDVNQNINSCAVPQTAFTPQVFSNNIIDDTLNWVRVQGSFLASGAEKFITIGNFFDFANTDMVTVHYTTDQPTGVTFYLVDDVSVIESTEVAHAGPDRLIAVGDSVHIGTSEEGMPCAWYVMGSSTPVGYSGGIWVKPTITTSYVVEMDLCGHVTRDTMKVSVYPVGITSPGLSEGEEVWPNPVRDELHVDEAKGSEVRVYDITGRSMKLTMTGQTTMTLKGDKEVIDVSNLPKGMYIVQIVDAASGYKTVRKIVKE